MLTIHHCFLLEEDQHQVSKISQINLYQSTTGKCLICRSVSSLVFLIVNWSIWSWSQCNKPTKKEGLILHQCILVYYVVHNNKCHVLLPNSHACNLTSISCLFTCMFANYIPIPSEKNQLYRVFIVFQHYLTTTWKMQCKKKKNQYLKRKVITNDCKLQCGWEI